MTRIKTVKWKEFVGFLQSRGLNHIRTKGDHFVFDKEPPLDSPVIITKCKEIPMFHIMGNLRSMQCTKDELEIFLQGYKKVGNNHN